MKMVEVNRAPVQIHHSGRARDLGQDTFEKNKIKIKINKNEIKGIKRASWNRFGSAIRVELKRGATTMVLERWEIFLSFG